MRHSRLMAMTVAIEDAVTRRAWPEVHALFAERGRVLNETTEVDLESMKKVIEADKRLQQRIQTMRADVLKRMTRLKQASAANRLYRKRTLR